MSEEKKSEGLGDTLQKIITKSGVEKLVKIISVDSDCGCNKRKEKLNKMFPYKK
mgnify:FL=1